MPVSATVLEQERDEAMLEQLEYLFKHARSARSHTAASCPECVRLKSVSQILLSPFLTVLYENMTIAAQAKQKAATQ